MIFQRYLALMRSAEALSTPIISKPFPPFLCVLPRHTRWGCNSFNGGMGEILPLMENCCIVELLENVN
jgi:hypothetical protein